MAEILQGKPVADALVEKLKVESEALHQKGVTPTLAIVRLGERGDDIYYEKGAMKRAASVGVTVKNFVLKADATQDELVQTIVGINKDPSIHGVLLFFPLPKSIDDNLIRNTLLPAKDMDGITYGSLAGVFTGTPSGYPPCTAQACMEILDYYNINVTGKKVTVIGRSLVIGKPAAMQLVQRNATVTICHTKTVDMPAVCREAEVLIVAAGRAEIVDHTYFNPNQIVIDVGINVGKDGKVLGDVNFAEAEQIVKAVTPVPGGVGSVTTSVLMKNVLDAAKKTLH